MVTLCQEKNVMANVPTFFMGFKTKTSYEIRIMSEKGI